ncbi:MAG: 30S ribosomal protein S6 [Clostridia bacterium]|nr:30S ribosomal protein S6 [Clostridia bacterium]MDH7573729.1 30S ribosomal protein S6 [Clostridia bacterium]
MRAYEVMYVLRPDLEEEEIAAQIERFNRLIQEEGGEVEQVSRWGKRRLAYEVNRFREGYYVLLHFRSRPAAARELERVFKISDQVIRYLIVRRPEKAAAKPQQPEKAEQAG